MIDLYFWTTPNGYKPLRFLEALHGAFTPEEPHVPFERVPRRTTVPPCQSPLKRRSGLTSGRLQ